MSVFGGLKGLIVKWLGIVPATSQLNITVKENITKELSVLKNKLWYRGDPVELEQFFKQVAEMSADVTSSIPKTKFWAASADMDLIRKMHSGLPRMIADKLAAIVVNDMNEPDIDTATKTRWDEFCRDTEFDELLKGAVVQALTEGDGAFKVCVDSTLSKLPLLEFYSGNDVEFTYKRGKLLEILFYTDYWLKAKHMKLVEHYGKGYVKYELLDDNGAMCDLTSLEETATLSDITFTGDYIMGVPLKFYKSAKWQNRGDSLFEGKDDMFDAFDECVSTWMDALRAGRVKQYIPETLIPRNEDNGAMMKPNVFNPYYAVGASLQEDSVNEIQVKQGDVKFDGLVATYCTFLDGCLQGIISPSTLGIDVKKLDNADSQREKEKTTMYTRDTLIGVLAKALPKVLEVVLKTWDNMLGSAPAEKYEGTFEWGQYANPSFEAMIETIAKAKVGGIMSTEQCVEELYGDTMDEEDKALEVTRIKAENGAATVVDEPLTDDVGNMDKPADGMMKDKDMMKDGE